MKLSTLRSLWDFAGVFFMICQWMSTFALFGAHLYISYQRYLEIGLFYGLYALFTPFYAEFSYISDMHQRTGDLFGWYAWICILPFVGMGIFGGLCYFANKRFESLPLPCNIQVASKVLSLNDNSKHISKKEAADFNKRLRRGDGQEAFKIYFPELLDEYVSCRSAMSSSIE